MSIRKRNRSNHAIPSPPPWFGAPAVDLDRVRELETENALLRARVAELVRQRDEATTEGPDATVIALRDLDAVGSVDDPVEDDGSVEAFEDFLALSDPHLDRVRRFLLG